MHVKQHRRFSDPGFQQPLQQRPWSPRARWAAILIAVGALGGLASFLSGVDWERVYRGAGYVPWRLTQAHAVEDCRQFGKHLVVYTVDPAHPAAERFEAEVLTSSEVQRLSAGLIWLKEELTPAAALAARAEAETQGPLPPSVRIVGWELETVLAGPVDASRVTPAAFAGLMREALEISATPSEVR